ncbi:MAG TPA: Pycsar system effector family protein [Allosphingosinicella sp.]|nr:Pycsar system effector family protein [Allosphingosinicella sp.]
MTERTDEGAPDATSQIYPPNAVHLMRTAQLAQLQLSAMADAKASLLMGATFVIFTITIGQARDGLPPLPLLILGGAAFFAAIFAVLAVIPMTSGKRKGGRPNILFFGTFSHMAEDAFIEEMTGRLTTEDSIYRTMARDIHQAGTVLETKKYRLLSWAYRIFLLGLVASGAAFVIRFV